jgi:hypothetical protein
LFVFLIFPRTYILHWQSAEIYQAMPMVAVCRSVLDDVQAAWQVAAFPLQFLHLAVSNTTRHLFAACYTRSKQAGYLQRGRHRGACAALRRVSMLISIRININIGIVIF